MRSFYRTFAHFLVIILSVFATSHLIAQSLELSPNFLINDIAQNFNIAHIFAFLLIFSLLFSVYYRNQILQSEIRRFVSHVHATRANKPSDTSRKKRKKVAKEDYADIEEDFLEKYTNVGGKTAVAYLFLGLVVFGLLLVLLYSIPYFANLKQFEETGNNFSILSPQFFSLAWISAIASTAYIISANFTGKLGKNFEITLSSRILAAVGLGLLLGILSNKQLATGVNSIHWLGLTLTLIFGAAISVPTPYSYLFAFFRKTYSKFEDRDFHLFASCKTTKQDEFINVFNTLKLFRIRTLRYLTKQNIDDYIVYLDSSDRTTFLDLYDAALLVTNVTHMEYLVLDSAGINVITKVYEYANRDKKFKVSKELKPIVENVVDKLQSKLMNPLDPDHLQEKIRSLTFFRDVTASDSVTRLNMNSPQQEHLQLTYSENDDSKKGK